MAVQLHRREVNTIASRYAKAVREKFGVSAVYLFGSSAKDGLSGESDIDIAVVSSAFSGDVVNDTFELMKLRRGIDTRIEPHPVLQKDFNTSNPFAREIMNTGIRFE